MEFNESYPVRKNPDEFRLGDHPFIEDAKPRSDHGAFGISADSVSSFVRFKNRLLAATGILILAVIIVVAMRRS